MDLRCQNKIGSKSSLFGFAFYTACIEIMILLAQYRREIFSKLFPSGFDYSPSIFVPNHSVMYTDTLN